jgi:single-strand DNA-binding protein
MSGSVNKVTLIGNVGKDPEIRSTQDGREIASIVLATSERWKDKATGERKEKTEWHRVSVFSEGLVSLIKNYVKKGSKLYLEGTLQTRKWVDNAGAERYTTEVILQNYSSTLVMLDGAKADGSSLGYASSNGDFKQVALEDSLEDEIPF